MFDTARRSAASMPAELRPANIVFPSQQLLAPQGSQLPEAAAEVISEQVLVLLPADQQLQVPEPLQLAGPAEVSADVLSREIARLHQRLSASGDALQAVVSVRYDAEAELRDPTPQACALAREDSLDGRIGGWIVSPEASALGLRSARSEPQAATGASVGLPGLPEQVQLALRLAVLEAGALILGLPPGAEVAWEASAPRCFAAASRGRPLALWAVSELTIGEPGLSPQADHPGASPMHIDPAGLQARLSVELRFACLPSFAGMSRAVHS